MMTSIALGLQVEVTIFNVAPFHDQCRANLLMPQDFSPRSQQMYSLDANFKESSYTYMYCLICML